MFVGLTISGAVGHVTPVPAASNCDQIASLTVLPFLPFLPTLPIPTFQPVLPFPALPALPASPALVSSLLPEHGPEEDLARRRMPEKRPNQVAVIVEPGCLANDRHDAVGPRQFEQGFDFSIAQPRYQVP